MCWLIRYKARVRIPGQASKRNMKNKIYLRRFSSSRFFFLKTPRVNIHTYIIGHYNPSVRIIDLVSHTIYVVCVIFIHKWWDLQLNVDSERQIFKKLFHGTFIYSHSFCQKSAWRESLKKYLFFTFCFDA